MKRYNFLCIVLLWTTVATGSGDSSLVSLAEHAKLEMATVQEQFEQRRWSLISNWKQLESKCQQTSSNHWQCWQDLRKLEKEWMWLEQQESLQLLRIRYRKGIDLIKLLYEKILALDHHFSSMNTYQNILLMANPNNYQGFQQIQDVLEERLRKRNALQLPAILQSNTYLSATFSLVASLLGDGEPSQKQEDLERISCILDFTVRMHADLSVIQHETEYLKLANQQLRAACEQLFEDYVEVIDYLVPIARCRQNDDWESLYLQLETYIQELEGDLEEQMEQPFPYSRSNREVINLEFSTQRVAEFISKYNDFINLGTQYYQKFDNIVTSYENEASCKTELPYQFAELQEDIEQTIVKFDDTYRLPEIHGSRMKDLLYGLPD